MRFGAAVGDRTPGGVSNVLISLYIYIESGGDGWKSVQVPESDDHFVQNESDDQIVLIIIIL